MSRLNKNHGQKFERKISENYKENQKLFYTRIKQHKEHSMLNIKDKKVNMIRKEQRRTENHGVVEIIF